MSFNTTKKITAKLKDEDKYVTAKAFRTAIEKSYKLYAN